MSNFFALLKGGPKDNMETKSRYEVIAELEDKKRNLILQRDALPDKLKAMEKEIKEMKRDVEDKEEEVTDFKKRMEENKETIKELIKSIDESLGRFSKLNENKNK